MRLGDQLDLFCREVRAEFGDGRRKAS